MEPSRLKYLNALNILVNAQIGSLKKISELFNGNFEHAWHSAKLKSLLPADAPSVKSVDPEKEFEKTARANLELIAITDPLYPRALKHISDPPFLLYIKGDKKVLKNKCFAVVGTRALTDYGKRIAPAISGQLVDAGFTIVSGLAMGIDGLAHRAAVERNSPTIAVLGGGINDQTIVYENRKLAQDIVKTGGAIISEYPVSLHGSKISFPLRNRIISGLSKGVLVIEADEKSGALITAKSALDQNRDVFAVPGSIFSSKSKGTNNLIKAGAKPVLTIEDILTEYDLQGNLLNLGPKPSNELEKTILELIGEGVASLDELIRTCSKQPAQVISCLMDMELENKVKNLGNNRFALRQN